MQTLDQQYTKAEIDAAIGSIASAIVFERAADTDFTANAGSSTAIKLQTSPGVRPYRGQPVSVIEMVALFYAPSVVGTSLTLVARSEVYFITSVRNGPALEFGLRQDDMRFFVPSRLMALLLLKPQMRPNYFQLGLVGHFNSGYSSKQQELAASSAAQHQNYLAAQQQQNQLAQQSLGNQNAYTGVAYKYTPEPVLRPIPPGFNHPSMHKLWMAAIGTVQDQDLDLIESINIECNRMTKAYPGVRTDAYIARYAETMVDAITIFKATPKDHASVVVQKEELTKTLKHWLEDTKEDIENQANAAALYSVASLRGARAALDLEVKQG